MTIIFYVLAIVALLIVAGIQFKPANLSRFELERRAAQGDTRSLSTIRRERLLQDLYSIYRVKVASLLVIITVLGIVIFGWALGIVVSLFIALEFGAVARLALLQRVSQKLHEMLEPKILNVTEKFPKLFTLLRSVSPFPAQVFRLGSRQELIHLISQSGSILSDQDRRLMTHGLGFNDKIVGSVMTPRESITTISKKELLGPLVLDDLHKTGHSRFPVIDQNIDHIVGILHIQNLLSLGIRKSITAEKAMEPQLHYIREDQSLSHALTTFIKVRQHLLIVINKSRETVGILSLEDVIEELLGHKIKDEFDAHDDLHAVAQRDTSHKNHTSNY